MARPEVTISKGALCAVNEQSTKAIRFITQKDYLDECDIQAIETLLRMCRWSNDTLNPKNSGLMQHEE